MIRALFVAVALFAAACAAPTPVEQATQTDSATFVGIDGRPLVTNGVTDHSVQEALTADPAACAKAGGQLTPVCRMQKPMCLIAFKDAGKACSDGSECGSGRCLAGDPKGTGAAPATGVCAKTNDPCGCYARVTNGAVQPAICVD